MGPEIFQQLQQACVVGRVGEGRSDVECHETMFCRRDFDQIFQSGQDQCGTGCVCCQLSGLQVVAAEVVMIGKPGAAADLQAEGFTRAAKSGGVPYAAHQVHGLLMGCLQRHC